VTRRHSLVHRMHLTSIHRKSRIGGSIPWYAFLLLLLWMPETAEAQLEVAEAEEAEEVLSVYTRTVYPDGTETEELTGSNVVTLRDGSTFAVGVNHLEDPDGGSYYIVGDAYQESEDSPVVYQVQLVRGEVDTLSENEIVDAYLEGKPDATPEELAAFQDRRAARFDVPEPFLRVNESVTDWLETADEEDVLDVFVTLEEQPALALPRLHNNLLEEDVVFWLDQMEERLVAIESRKTELEVIQEPYIQYLEQAGGRLLDQYWIVNEFKAEVTPHALSLLMEYPGISSIYERGDAEPALNQGDEIREAQQVNQYLDAGYNGALGSGRNEVGDIYVAVLDHVFDVDHPAWRDWLYSNPATRLEDVWCFVSGSWTSVVADCQAAFPEWQNPTLTEQHGTQMAGILLADLTQGQDANYPGTGTPDQLARTGFSTETSFTFIESEDADLDDEVQKIMELNVDIVTHSLFYRSQALQCYTGPDYNSQVDKAYHDGVFWVNCAANSHIPGVACDVPPPATASGSFTVAATVKNAADLQNAEICSGSRRGEHPDIDYTMIDLAAVGGRQGQSTPDYNLANGSFYNDAGYCSTSQATPSVAGAAANLKHHFLTIFDPADVNEPGLIHASMLAMGDGQLEIPIHAGKTTPNDPRWGAGRMRMRLLTGPGMDSPWRWRYYIGVLGDGQVKYVNLHPNAYGVNQPVPEEAEFFTAALWYHEPNLDHDAGEVPADIALRVQQSPSVGYTCSGYGPRSQRLTLGDDLNGGAWKVKLTGLNVPAGTDPDDQELFNEEKRKVFLAFYWEDGAWDDPNGPNIPMRYEP
jgi:hypothetical protein